MAAAYQQFPCHICGVILTPSNYEFHMNGHLDEKPKPFMCAICGQAFVHPAHLTQHELDHTGPFSCGMCRQQFATHGELKKHWELVNEGHEAKFHVKTKPEELTYQLVNEGHEAKFHVKTKPEELSYQCPICGKQFKNSGGLKLHEFMHEPASHCECMVCNQVYDNPTDLEKHIMTHNECVLCGQQFLSRMELEQHASTHSYISL